MGTCDLAEMSMTGPLGATKHATELSMCISKLQEDFSHAMMAKRSTDAEKKDTDRAIFRAKRRTVFMNLLTHFSPPA